jgi:hypothetical protein
MGQSGGSQNICAESAAFSLLYGHNLTFRRIHSFPSGSGTLFMEIDILRRMIFVSNNKQQHLALLT